MNIDTIDKWLIAGWEFSYDKEERYIIATHPSGGPVAPFCKISDEVSIIDGDGFADSVLNWINGKNR